MATLALGSFMGTARYLRASLDEVLGQDYILAARARGLPERRVLLGHALRNALLPVITLVGLSLPFLLGGAVVVEVVFGWPGMGRVTVEAIWARDYPVIMATTLVSARDGGGRFPAGGHPLPLGRSPGPLHRGGGGVTGEPNPASGLVAADAGGPIRVCGPV